MEEKDVQFSPYVVLVEFRILSVCVLEFYVLSEVWSVWFCGSFCSF